MLRPGRGFMAHPDISMSNFIGHANIRADFYPTEIDGRSPLPADCLLTATVVLFYIVNNRCALANCCRSLVPSFASCLIQFYAS